MWIFTKGANYSENLKQFGFNLFWSKVQRFFCIGFFGWNIYIGFEKRNVAYVSFDTIREFLEKLKEERE